MDKGTALNLRVWTLFENAGFRTKPGSGSSAEHEVEVSPHKKIPVDLFATDPELKVTILGSNKSGGVQRFTEHVTSYKNLGAKAKADRVLFVLTGVDVSDDDRMHVKAEGMSLWTEEELSYFEAVTDAIGPYAKYEIIHSLGLTTHEEKGTHRVLALRFLQPTSSGPTEIFLFTVCPEWLLKTCAIYRRAMGNASAYQRMLRKTRLPQIRAFVTRANAMLPTNIIVSLSEKVTFDEIKNDAFHDAQNKLITLSRSKDCQLVVLNFPMEYSALELIDGQHRLYGFVKADAATTKDFNLVVAGIKGLGLTQKRDAFVAINDNSRRMDANLVAYLKYTDNDVLCQADSELMAIRIVVDLSKQAPFKKAIKLLDVGTQKLTLKGLSGYDLKGLIGPKGLLRKYHTENTPQAYITALRTYFGTVKSTFGVEWKNPDKYIVATNRGVTAFLKLLKSILKTEKSALDQTTIQKYLKALDKHWNTWEFEKLRSAYVGSQGWSAFHKDLVSAIREEYPKFKS